MQSLPLGVLVLKFDPETKLHSNSRVIEVKLMFSLSLFHVYFCNEKHCIAKRAA